MPKIKINNTHTYYEVTGSGHPLVFIHGGGLESSSWYPQVKYFSNKFRVITYDIREHGRSEYLGDSYSISDCVKDLYYLLDYLLVQQTYLVGFSMGGNISLSFTLDYPEIVDTLILSGSSASPLPAIEVKRSEEAVARIRLTKGPDAAIKFVKAYKASVARPDITCRLGEIRIPTQIIVGNQDTYERLYLSEVLHKGIANSDMAKLPNCGHICHRDQPDIFNSIVDDFLQRVQECK